MKKIFTLGLLLVSLATGLFAQQSTAAHKDQFNVFTNKNAFKKSVFVGDKTGLDATRPYGASAVSSTSTDTGGLFVFRQLTVDPAKPTAAGIAFVIDAVLRGSNWANYSGVKGENLFVSIPDDPAISTANTLYVYGSNINAYAGNSRVATSNIFGASYYAEALNGAHSGVVYGSSVTVSSSGSGSLVDVGRGFTTQCNAMYSGAAMTSCVGFFSDSPFTYQGGTVTRAAGFLSAEQNKATHNSNLVLGQATVPDGNWNIYSASTKTNYFAGPFTGASNILEFRNGTSAQTLRVFNTYTDASNYERASFGWSGNNFTVGPEAAGTGTQRPLLLQGQYVAVNTNFTPTTTNTRSLGTSSLRWQYGYFGTSIDISGAFGANNAIELYGTGATDQLIIRRRAGDGTTSSRTIYDRYITNETTPQEWRVGLIGSKDFIITDATNTRTPFKLLASSGDASFAGTIYSPAHLSSAGLSLGTSAANDLAFLTNNTTRWLMTSAGNITPWASNSYDLGSTGSRVKNGYFGTVDAVGVSTGRIITSTTTPTVAATGIGATGTVAMNAGSSDLAGIIIMTVNGAGPAASGTATLTFSTGNGALGTNGPACVASLYNATNAWNPRATVIVSAASTTSVVFNWDNNSVALGAGNIGIVYHCIGK